MLQAAKAGRSSVRTVAWRQNAVRMGILPRRQCSGAAPLYSKSERAEPKLCPFIRLRYRLLAAIAGLLLLFFVVTTTFSRPNQLKIDLPEAASGTPPEATELKQLEVAISADGTYTLKLQW